MNKCKVLNIFCIIIGCYSGLIKAQPVINFEQLKSKYNQSNLMYLENTEHMTIDVSGTGLVIESEILQQVLMLSEQGMGFSERTLGYSDYFETLQDIEAYTYVPDGKGYTKQKVRDIEDRKASKDGIFYDDAKEKYFVFPGLQPGAIAHLSYKQIYKDPHFIGSFWFGSYMPVKHSSFSITVPSTVKIKYKIFGDSTQVKFSKTESKSKTTYRWDADNLEKKEFESDAGTMSNRPTHIVPYIAEYVQHGKPIKVLADMDGFYNWYYKFAKDVNKSDMAEVQHLVDSLCAGSHTEEEKIKAIYYWVQDNIKYVAFEDGLGGYIPRDANVVCSRRYGDCKDMSSLLTKMLRMAGIEAYMTLVGTRDIPYSYNDFTTPQINNHMICAVKYKNDWQLLDGTFEKLPFGTIPYHIQDKEALIIEGENKYTVFKVPVLTPEKNISSDSLIVGIDGRTLKGKGYYAYKGYGKIKLDMQMNAMAKKDIYERLQNFVRTGNNKCKVDTLTYSGALMRDEPLTVNYTFTLDDYITQVDNSVYVNMNFDKPFSTSHIDKEEKKYERQHSFVYTDIYHVSLEVPHGYKVVSVPQSLKQENKLFAFEFKYTQSGNKILLQRTITVKALVVQPEDFDAWNEIILKLAGAYKKVPELSLIK